MNYGEFELRIIRNVGNRTDPETKAIIYAQTNNILEQMMIVHEWEELQQTSETSLIVGHSTTYQLAELGIENLHKIYSITLYDSSRWLPPLTYYPPFKWEQQVRPAMGNTTSKPGSWTMIGKKFIEFSCSAAENYPLRILYYQKAYPIGLLYDEATPDPTWEIPYEDSLSLVESAVTGYVWLALEDLHMAQTWFNIAKGLTNTYCKEARQLLNFQVVSRRETPVVGTPWADPFIRR